MTSFCAQCTVHACKKKEGYPSSCVSLSEPVKAAEAQYADEQTRILAEASGKTALAGGMTRIEETMDYCRRCGFHHLGLAFCSLLWQEAKKIDEIFRYNGFETESVICKVGGLSKEVVGLTDNGSAMCNPIAQAQLLNSLHTDINILVGLCVGHDSLFIKYSEAPVTVLAVKDKILGHNPLGVLPIAESGNYKNKLFPPK